MILQIHSEWEDYEELSDRIDEEPDRYHQIEPLISRQSFQIMEDFAESLPASSWKSRLLAALSRNKPFRRFRDEVHADLRLAKNCQLARVDPEYPESSPPSLREWRLVKSELGETGWFSGGFICGSTLEEYRLLEMLQLRGLRSA